MKIRVKYLMKIPVKYLLVMFKQMLAWHEATDKLRNREDDWKGKLKVAVDTRSSMPSQHSHGVIHMHKLMHVCQSFPGREWERDRASEQKRSRRPVPDAV